MSSTTTDRLAGVTAGLSSKAPVRVATTANITLSGEQTIDGVAVVADDRVLVKDQTDGIENGIYDAKSGAWVRSLDFDGTGDVKSGTFVVIASGTAGAGLVYRISTADDITIGTTSITWTLMTVESASAFAATLLAAATAAAARTVLGAIATLAEDTSPQLGGFLDPNGKYIGRGKGGDIASASPLVIDTDGDYFDVTGTTGFSAMTVATNRFFVLQFDGAVTITVGSGITLNNAGNNVTTAAGDIIICQSTAADTVVGWLIKADGTSVVTSSISQADQTAMEAETDENTYVPPDLIKYSPGVAKCWIQWIADGTINGSYNVTSLTDNGTGDWTVNVATDFSDTNYACGMAGGHSDVGSANVAGGADPQAVGAIGMQWTTSTGVLSDGNAPWCGWAFGDH
jgi:hypothetical protein